MDLSAGVPARFVKDLELGLDELGRPQVTAGHFEQIASQDFSEYLTVVLNDEGVWHYFHFMETMIWLWIVRHLFLRSRQPKRLVFLHPWDNPHQNHVQRAFLNAAYPHAQIYDDRSPFPLIINSAVVIDRAWQTGSLNKFNEDCLNLDFGLIRRMSEGVRRAVSALPAKQARLRATYIKRNPPRCLDPEIERQLLGVLNQRFEVIMVDFAKIPWEQQVRISAITDLMIGVHGNGLTNALWMRPGSLLVEFFPLGVHHYDYQLLAELAGVQYFGLEGENVFSQYCRVGPPYGHTPAADKAVNTIDLRRLSTLLSTWKGQDNDVSNSSQALSWPN